MEPPTRLQRSDTTRGTPLKILSLDGGGVRGYSMLIILHDFMHKVYTESHDGIPPEPDHVPKPCDYFDLIVGTGTGGLIALMLGRLRMDTTACMRVYVQMTRKVFETDKTIVGIPYRSTLFKASMLEQAIRSCVRSYDSAGISSNDRGGEDSIRPLSSVGGSHRHRTRTSSLDGNSLGNRPRRSSSGYSADRRFSLEVSPFSGAGDPHAPLEDLRRNQRCKTAVTAVLKGPTEHAGTAVFLRSYPSRTQPALEPSCTIWQAGRATCATKLAFKEIRIGTSTFLDEGYGLRNMDRSATYNPAPEALEEALINEWPGQKLGLLVSLGTGKRPGGSSAASADWWEGFAGGLGSYAEAKRRLISKIEGCEKTHNEILKIHFPRYGIDAQKAYLRLNVEVGVGEFGMNEWNRLAEISNNTQSYLNSPAVKSKLSIGACEMAKIDRMRSSSSYISEPSSPKSPLKHYPYPQLHPAFAAPQHPSGYSQEAIELPASDVDLAPRPLSWSKVGHKAFSPPTYNERPGADEKYTIIASDELPEPCDANQTEGDQYRVSSSDFSSVTPSLISSLSAHTAGAANTSEDAPPLPPKTPIELRARSSISFAPHQSVPSLPSLTNPQHQLLQLPHHTQRQHHRRSLQGLPPVQSSTPQAPPYPDLDGPPPAVNMARKPRIS